MSKKPKLPRTHKELEALIAAQRLEAYNDGATLGASRERLSADSKLASMRTQLGKFSEEKQRHVQIGIQALFELAQSNRQIGKEIGFALGHLMGPR